MQSLPGSVTLEILRHGPPHNQLLSPLTQYLALCGNYGATTINVPYEHAQFRARLRPLMYSESEPLRQLQLQETSADMGRILEKVPGLIAALSEAGGRELGQRWNVADSGDTSDANLMSQRPVHLELVLSASELALLPFELAQSPEGCPGSGRPLLLQSQMPICLTRRVRHNNHAAISWNRPPRILLAAASPGGVVPLQEHVNAIVLALQPWVDRSESLKTDPAERYKDHLTILPQASWSQIEATLAAACDENPSRPFTHVHLLAHGVSIKEAGSRWYGVQLHDSHDPNKPDNVTAQQLALALRPAGKEGRGGFSIPTVVTLATCQGAGQRSVVGAGASVAHTLHEAGIPLVIASQFPLTFAGSIVMAKLLYRGFLRGHDPQVLITRLRRELRGVVKDSHDWASIVAYASFDANMGAQLKEFRYQQSKRSAEQALQRYYREFSDDSTGGSGPDPQPVIEWLKSALDRLEAGVIEHPGVPGPQGYNVHGQIAATHKKLAYMKWKAASNNREAGAEQKSNAISSDVLQSLKTAAYHYRKAYRFDPLAGWARVQELLLRLILNDLTPAQARQHWKAARHSGSLELRRYGRKHGQQVWRNRLELALLKSLIPQHRAKQADRFRNNSKPQAKKLLAKLQKSASFDQGQYKSLSEQLDRYIEFLPEVAQAVTKANPAPNTTTQQSSKVNSTVYTVPRQWRHLGENAANLVQQLKSPALESAESVKPKKPKRAAASRKAKTTGKRASKRAPSRPNSN